MEETTRKFDDFAQRSYERALRYARWITRDAEEANDVLQEAFLKAYRYFEKSGKLPLAPVWFQQVVRRVHIDRLRAKGRRIQAISLQETLTNDPSIEPQDKRANPEAEVLASVPDTMVERLISTLPPEEAKAVRLSLREDLDEADKARELSCSPRSFRQKLSRARRYMTQAVRAAGAVPLGNFPSETMA